MCPSWKFPNNKITLLKRPRIFSKLFPSIRSAKLQSISDHHLHHDIFLSLKWDIIGSSSHLPLAITIRLGPSGYNNVWGDLIYVVLKKIRCKSVWGQWSFLCFMNFNESFSVFATLRRHPVVCSLALSDT